MGPSDYPVWSAPRRSSASAPTVPAPCQYPWIVWPFTPPAPTAQPVNILGAARDAIYPHIAAGLTAVPFDLRRKPREYGPDQYDRHSRYSVFLQPTKRVRLVCKNFPWTVEIKDEWVYCSRVWDAVYNALQKPIKRSEWALIANDETKTTEIRRARDKRLEQYPDEDRRPKRIDWLGEMTLFRGLERDDAFAKRVLLPGKDENMETCLIRLDSHWPMP